MNKVISFIVFFTLSISGLFSQSLKTIAAPGDPELSVSYQTHIQNVGWQDVVKDGAASGTVGRSLRLEAIKINVTGSDNINVIYKTHIQQLGWSENSYDGKTSGSVGRSYRLEAISIMLDGTDSDKYDIYYRVHCQDYGWLGWASNGSYAGTSGQSRRLEAIEIKIVNKDSGSRISNNTRQPYIITKDFSFKYQVHGERDGWTSLADEGYTAESSDGITYLNFEWKNEETSTPFVWTTWDDYSRSWSGYFAPSINMGQAASGPVTDYRPRNTIPMTAIRLETKESGYDIYYRVWMSESNGWLDWVKNGEVAGLTKDTDHVKITKIQIRMVKKGGSVPKS